MTGEQLMDLRVDNFISQREMAKELGISRTTYWNYEKLVGVSVPPKIAMAVENIVRRKVAQRGGQPAG